MVFWQAHEGVGLLHIPKSNPFMNMAKLKLVQFGWWVKMHEDNANLVGRWLSSDLSTWFSTMSLKVEVMYYPPSFINGNNKDGANIAVPSSFLSQRLQSWRKNLPIQGGSRNAMYVHEVQVRQTLMGFWTTQKVIYFFQFSNYFMLLNYARVEWNADNTGITYAQAPANVTDSQGHTTSWQRYTPAMSLNGIHLPLSSRSCL